MNQDSFYLDFANKFLFAAFMNNPFGWHKPEEVYEAIPFPKPSLDELETLLPKMQEAGMIQLEETSFGQFQNMALTNKTRDHFALSDQEREPMGFKQNSGI